MRIVTSSVLKRKRRDGETASVTQAAAVGFRGLCPHFTEVLFKKIRAVYYF